MIEQLDQTITLALNGSTSLFWDNLMICITNTFSWSLVILMLLYIFFAFAIFAIHKRRIVR